MTAASGLIKILVFMILLLLLFWGVNIYKHIRSGGWKGFRRAVDIVGAVLLLTLFLGTLLPTLK